MATEVEKDLQIVETDISDIPSVSGDICSLCSSAQLKLTTSLIAALSPTNQIVSRVRAGYISHNGWTLDQHKSYRIHQLEQIKRMVEENEKRIYEAVWADLRKVQPLQDIVL